MSNASTEPAVQPVVQHIPDKRRVKTVVKNKAAIAFAEKRAQQIAIARLTPEIRNELGKKTNNWYLDHRFDAVSDLTREFADAESRRATIKAAARHPLSALSMRAVWKQIPALVVTIPDDDIVELNEILLRSSKLHFLNPEPIAMLEIPRHFDDYLIGHRKQALRSNQARAVELGCVALPVPQGDERVELNAKIREAMNKPYDHDHGEWPIRTRKDHLAVIGRSRTGEPLSVAVARRFGTLAVLDTFVRLKNSNDASASRHLVQIELVRHLHSAGVRFLVVGGAFRLSPGLQYLQHLVGFEPVHLKLLKSKDVG